jgi:hypothetical protein
VLLFPPEHTRLAAGPAGVQGSLALSRAPGRDANAYEVDPQ